MAHFVRDVLAHAGLQVSCKDDCLLLEGQVISEYALDTLIQGLNMLAPSLKRLSLCNNNIDGECISKLAPMIQKHKNLVSLELSNNPLGEIGISKLVSIVLPSVPELQILRLQDTSFGSTGTAQLKTCLPLYQELQNLALCGNNINDIGIELLFDGLHNFSSLNTLELARNNISDIGIVYISEILAKNVHLCLLNLSGNKFTGEGCTQMGPALTQLMELEILLLQSNKIDSAGFQVLLRAIGRHNHLHTVDVSDNEITSDGFIGIGGILEQHPALHILGLNNNKIDVIAFDILLDIITFNETLTINLANNRLNPHQLEHLQNARTQRTQQHDANEEAVVDQSRPMVRRFPSLRPLTTSFKRNILSPLSRSPLAKIVSPLSRQHSVKLVVPGAAAATPASILGSPDSIREHEEEKPDAKIASLEPESAGKRKQSFHKENVNFSDSKNSSTSSDSENDTSVSDPENDSSSSDSGSSESEKDLYLEKMYENWEEHPTRGVRDIQQIIKDAKTFGVIRLAKVCPSFFDIQMITSALHSMGALTEINLSSNNISCLEAETLAAGISTLHFLRDLTLSHNQIGDTGANEIVSSVGSTQGIRNLRLDNNRITKFETGTIAEVLVRGNSLQALYLNDNLIGSKCACDFADGLKANSSLKILSLSHNKIDDEGAIAFALMLDWNNYLGFLELQNNMIGENGHSVLKILHEHTKAQVHIKLGGKPTGGPTASSCTLTCDFSPKANSFSREDCGKAGEFQIIPRLQCTPEKRYQNMGFYRAQISLDVLYPSESISLLRLSLIAQEVNYLSTQVNTKLKQRDLLMFDREVHIFEQITAKQALNPLEELGDLVELQRLIENRKKAFDTSQLKVRQAPSANYSLRDHHRRKLFALLETAMKENVQARIARSLTIWRKFSEHSVVKEVQETDEVLELSFRKVLTDVCVALEAIRLWQAKYNLEHLKEARRIVLENLRSAARQVGIDDLFNECLYNTKSFEKLTKEMKFAYNAFDKERKALLSENFTFNAPRELVAQAIATLNEYSTRIVMPLCENLSQTFEGYKSLFKYIEEGLERPDTTQLVQVLSDLERGRDLVEDYKYAKRKLTRAHTKAERTAYEENIAKLELQLESVDFNRLDRRIRQMRTRLIKLAQDHYPELLSSKSWYKEIGVSDEMFLETSALGICLTGTKMSDFEQIQNLSSSNGKIVVVVKDSQEKVWVLKRFPLGEASSAGRFYRQVAALVRMDSAHVVRIEGIFQDSAHGVSYGCVLMPYYPRGDLEKWITENTHANEETRKRLGVGILMAAYELHKNGHVHCDIKPANIFLTLNLSPVLGDFDGVQKSNCTITHAVQSTQRYNAPELHADELDKVSEKVDMYSIGVLFEDLFPSPNDNMRKLISQLKSVGPAQRPSASEALQHPAFNTEPIALKSCIICLENYPENGGTCCKRNHFVCDPCLGDAVAAALLDPTSAVCVSEDGSMACMKPDCDFKISGADTAKHVPKEAFQKLLKIVQNHLERRLAIETEQKIEQSVKRALQQSVLERMTKYHVWHIQNRLLCICCPKCSTVFTDFSGCCALQCSNQNCAHHFCGWCLDFCDKSSSVCHKHVAKCARNVSKHVDPFFPKDVESVKKSWREIRRTRLIHYWNTKVTHRALRQKVEEQIRPLLTPDVVEPIVLPIG